MSIQKEFIVAIVGLGYVGLPLAVEFGKKYQTIGYDLADEKIASYKQHCDPNRELTCEDLRAAVFLEFTSDPARLKSADFIIIAVPTPVDKAHRPDLSPLVASSATVGNNMKRGVTVIYESTVYPGATEEICIPLLETHSGMVWGKDFYVGYSPERVNPGDKDRTLPRIVKVVSGDNATTLEAVGDLYASVIPAGVHRASSIKVAEAAKVIENTQRDLNIALVNELSMIFNRLGIDTLDVLEAAGTKWNFLPFRPGLVGGHCIGVDPYYLTHKSEMLGYQPQVILSGRRINDSMSVYIAEQTVKQMIKAGNCIRGSRVCILGLTFKENCSDIRNSKVADLVRELTDYGCEVSVHDPVAEPKEALHEYGITLESWENLPTVDAIVAAVSHRHYLERPLNVILEKLAAGGIFVDVKSAYDRFAIAALGYVVWRL